jgi:hypothetical protein
MRAIIFPVEQLVILAKRHNLLTYLVFFACILLALIKGYLTAGNYDPYWIFSFFDTWTVSGDPVVRVALHTIYSPLGQMLVLVLVFLLYLWLMFLLSGLKTHIHFKEFTLSFLGLSYLGIFLWPFSWFSWLSGFDFSSFIIPVVIIYWVLSYLLILTKHYRITLARASISVCMPLVCLFLLGGFPIIAPYLAWF